MNNHWLKGRGMENNRFTWIDLYGWLNEKANKLENIGKFDWQKEIGRFDQYNKLIFDLVDLDNKKEDENG